MMQRQARLDALAGSLFFEFARMEYALKAAGYLRWPDGDAEPDWTRFAVGIENEFSALLDSDASLRDAVEGFTAKPPRKQVVHNGQLGWADAPVVGGPTTDRLLVYVRRVRNNLFHGGKFGGRWLDPERSEFLIPSCLIILRACRQVAPDVRNAYEQR